MIMNNACECFILSNRFIRMVRLLSLAKLRFNIHFVVKLLVFYYKGFDYCSSVDCICIKSVVTMPFFRKLHF